MNCTLSFLDMYNKQIFSNKTGMMPMKRKCPLIEFKSRKGVDNKLKIVFEFDLMRHDWNNTYDPLRNDLARLQADGTNSDVVLKTPTREFKAHKLILSCRSPVFAAMFNHDTREQNENVVQIMDISDDVLEQLLAFIYTDLVPRLHEMTIDLLIVADKYDIKALKSRCESCIFDTVTIQNATELLLTADRANATKLRTNIKQFIIRRRGEFIRSNDYQELRRSHPELILEIFEQPTND
uniref:BTB domain-containing protein n=1 Tax=Bracon brevicornis TaxID=1563983 RepID=A0A6V7HP88_9HYME